MTLTPGIVLANRYTIDTILGQGGMGAVYCAFDANLGIHVAVKENLFLSDEYARQFQREASILANLRHTNLPRVIDYFDVPGQGQYLIMDFIEGEDLRQRIERTSTISEKEAVIIGTAICEALDYLHTRKPPVVHRDIKPGNIKITPEGEIVLVDFGLAKLMHDNQATTTGARAMTPGYSPPEQYGTARTDARTDIYSLGATLYAALTGVIPEEGLARATGKTDLTSIRELRPSIDRRLAPVIEKSLEVDPDKRYQTAMDFEVSLMRSGDISPNSRQVFRITPPPLEVIQSEKFEEPAANIKPASIKKNNRTNRSLRRIVTTTTALLTLLLILGLVFLQGTDITRIIGNLFSTSTVSVVSPTVPLNSSTATEPAAPTQVQTATLPVIAVQPSVSTTPTVSVSPTPEVTPIGGGTGKISFVSDRSGINQVWIMQADGTKARQLSNMAQGACQHAWSPDGTRLAVVSPCYTKDFSYPESKIYILDADGDNPQLLTVSNSGDFDPAWSPDGRRLAFTSLRTGTSHIFIYNFDDLTLEEISDTRYADSQAAWSPSGKQLAFVRLDIFNHIFIMSERGQTEFQFSSSGNVNDFWPVWSSDEEFILFARTQVNPTMPWLLKFRYEDRGKAAEKRIPPSGLTEIGPAWDPALSQDNQWIIYEGWPDGNNHDIFIMDIEGNNRARVTTDPGYDFNPVWVPGQ